MRTNVERRDLAGRRATNQRMLLLELILHSDGHLDADELYRRAREHEPNISLSTVYRNLKLFKKLDLVDELHFAEAHHHYEAKASAQHHHLVCLECGRVVEFTSPLTEKMKSRIEKDHDFMVTDTEVRVKGYCSQCKQDKKR
jgi:Fur family ferric uptake transcriptional regulator